MKGGAEAENQGCCHTGNGTEKIPAAGLFQLEKGDQITGMPQGEGYNTQQKGRTQQHIRQHAQNQTGKDPTGDTPVSNGGFSGENHIGHTQRHEPGAGESLQPQTAENIVADQACNGAEKENDVGNAENTNSVFHRFKSFLQIQKHQGKQNDGKSGPLAPL